MKTTKNKIFEEVDHLLDLRTVSGALDQLDNALLTYPALGRFKDKLEQVRLTYGYMRDYALQGLPDPGLQQSLAKTFDEVYSLRDNMEREVMATDAPTLYYNTLRFRRASGTDSIQALAEAYRSTIHRLSMATLAENAVQAQKELGLKAEVLEVRLFNAVWTHHPFSPADSETLSALLTDLSISTEAKALLISAITMGGLEWPDDRRLWLLMDTYSAPDTDTSVAARALVGILLLLSGQHKRPLSKASADRLSLMRDLPRWNSDVIMAAMLFVRSRDTERLTRKFDEELMPEMMKMRPEIERLRNNPVSPEDSEINPEWAEALSNSGLGDRLRELQELQEEGGDVMMATFRNLKTFPFFNDMPNWFRIFTPGHSQLQGTGGDSLGQLIQLLATSPGLCDSDKYSIALSLTQMPEAQRQMVSAQLKMQADAMAMAAAEGQAASLADYATSYVRSIYRFFKLFRRKGEFADPFTGGIEIISSPALAPEFTDRNFLELIAEFYFSKGYWEDALTVYSLITDGSELSATICQKQGFCYQSLGQYEMAAALYSRAEELEPGNVWTLTHLARTYQRLKMWKAAADVWLRVEKLRPAEDTSVALNLGICLMEQGLYSEALKYLHKVEFYAPGTEKAVRAMARCTLALGDYDSCTRYTLSLLTSASARPEDFLLAGNMALVTGHPDEAVGHYVDAIKMGRIGRREFLDTLHSHYRQLRVPAECTESLLAIVADTALSRASASSGSLL